MSRTISLEEPPIATEQELRAYLMRMRQDIAVALQQSQQLPVVYVEPSKPQQGKLYYFGSEIQSHPVITQEGLYVYKSTGWEFVA